jgi:hypothetical protein
LKSGRFINILLFTIAILCINAQRVAAKDVFYWNWSLAGKQIRVSGRLNEEKETSVFVIGQKTLDQFVFLYMAIEQKNHSQLPVYLRTVDTLSEELVKPFIEQLRRSSAIVLTVEPLLLFSPIEVLMADSVPLSLFRPMIFQIKERRIDIESDTLIISRGLILRDSTADTDNNCRKIFDRYPKSELKYIHQLTNKDLTRDHHIDFILVSAHGTIDGSSLEGGIMFNDTTLINQDFLEKNDPKLIYMDACIQGINTRYIASLSETKNINYYIGSVISVDLSDAATRTLNLFFSLLEKTHNPVLSLWNTKLSVFENYNNSGAVTSVLTAINKSLMFRIYKL